MVRTFKDKIGMTPITIYHNPQCATSRNTLAMIGSCGIEPSIVLYLETPPSHTQLTQMIKAMGVTVREVLRQKGTPYDELDLGNPHWTDAQLIKLMLKHPILINRPIVVSPLGTRLCRPSEEVLALLPKSSSTTFTKEDGEVVSLP